MASNSNENEPPRDLGRCKPLKRCRDLLQQIINTFLNRRSRSSCLRRKLFHRRMMEMNSALATNHPCLEAVEFSTTNEEESESPLEMPSDESEEAQARRGPEKPEKQQSQYSVIFKISLSNVSSM